MPETQWMTLLETADLMKRLPIQVTRMCEDGKLEYYVEDGRYFVSRESIDLFMHPRTDGPAPSNLDANGTPRRQYGRAPDDFEPSSEPDIESEPVTESEPVIESEPVTESEPVIESETVNGRNEADAAGEEETVNGRDETDAAGEEETGRIAQEASGADDENAEAREDVATPETADAPVNIEAEGDVEAQEDGATPETEVPVNEEAQEDVETQVDAEVPETASVPVDAETQDQAAPMTNPDDPSLRAVEILADLRAAIARHAREHKAFCDEIAGLADALESTLARDEDKTSELTREISSLLARYTRR